MEAVLIPGWSPLPGEPRGDSPSPSPQSSVSTVEKKRLLDPALFLLPDCLPVPPPDSPPSPSDFRSNKKSNFIPPTLMEHLPTAKSDSYQKLRDEWDFSTEVAESAKEAQEQNHGKPYKSCVLDTAPCILSATLQVSAADSHFQTRWKQELEQLIQGPVRTGGGSGI